MNESEVEKKINEVLQHHARQLENDHAEMEQFRVVADNEMWTGRGPFGDNGWFRPKANQTLKVRFTVNRVRPWLERRKADLYRVAPKVKVAQPLVSSAGRRGWSPKVGAALGDLATAWLTSPDVREALEMLQDLALVTKSAALKVSIDPTRRGLGAVCAQAIPRWDVVWDDAVDSVRRARWWGHLRWERVDEAKRLCPELPDQEGGAFGDFLRDGKVSRSTADEFRRPKGYIRLVEWWDMVEKTVQVFVVKDEHNVCAYGSSPEPMVTHPDGRPCVQLIPCVLAPSLAKPLRGVALARPQLDESVEKSYLASYVMTAVRRELARSALYRKTPGFTDREAKRVADSDDLEMIAIDDPSGAPLDQLIHVVQFPETTGGVERVMRLATELADQSTSQSALGRGSTSGVEYASATAAQALTAGDAAVASLAAARMQAVMVRAVEVMFALLGAGREGLKVATAGGTVALKPNHFRAEVEVTIDDQAAQAAQSSARKAELLQAMPLVRDLAALASTTATEGGASPDALRRAAEVLYDAAADAFQLPNEARWAAVVKTEPLVEEEDEDMELEEPAPAPAPVAPPGPPQLPPPEPDAAARLAAEMSPDELAELEQYLMQMEGSDAARMA